MRGSTYDNRANLAPAFLQQIVRKYEGTRLGRRELNAEILDDVPGALWSRALIEETRWPVHRNIPDLVRIVVAIDPAASTGEDADETGIIVAGKDADGHGYVLADQSARYAPTEWARTAIALYRQHKADRIVAEVNNGGDMVESTILRRGKQDEKPYCLTGECSRDVKRCLTKHAPVASRSCGRAVAPLPFNKSMLTDVGLWSCGRRVSVVQAQRQIHRALRAAVTIAAEVVVRTIAERAALAVPRRNTRIGSHGSEHHSVRGFSAPLLQATLQCPQLSVRVDAGTLSRQPLQ